MGNIKKLFIALSVIFLAIILYLSTELIHLGTQAKTAKIDYATLHSVEYGMFNSDVWTEKIIKIVDNKIQSFKLDSHNRDEIRGYIKTIINTLVTEAELAVKARNQGKRGFFDSLMGSTKQMITETIIDFEDLRNRVPEFTNKVMEEIERPENQIRAKKVLREKLKEFITEKFQKNTDMREYDAILKKYDVTTLKKCNALLDKKIAVNKQKMNTHVKIILSLSVVIIFLVLFQGVLSSITLLTLSILSTTLLVSGIMLPMLDIEAKISTLTFTILDQPIVFENQILFYQTKSISDLVILLFDSSDSRMILVGILLVMFSIIFPALKLIATTMYFYSQSIIGNNPVTRFFALYSTKWSMADVFVVSIFMAYLGLDGVVSNELRRLENLREPVNIITTNATHLEVGFFLFLAFVVVSFVLSILAGKVKSKSSEKQIK